MSARCRRPCPRSAAELGASLRQAGWLLSTVNLMTALGGMAIALTADRFGHRRLVDPGHGALPRREPARRDAGSVETLIVGRIFEGLGFITVVVAIPTLLLRIADAARPAAGHGLVDAPTCRPAPVR